MSSAMNKGSTMTTYIAETAQVYDRARVSGQARVYGQAMVYGRSWVSDEAQVYGQAMVCGEAWVYDRARVSGQARVYGQAMVCGQVQVSDQAQVYGRAHVSGETQVYGRARVYGRAVVCGQAEVSGQGDIASTRHYLTIGPVGSEDRTVTVHRHYDGPDSATWGHLVVAGCWQGMLDELAARIAADRTHGWREDVSRWRADYESLIAFARPRVAEWAAGPLTEEDHSRWAEVVGDIEREEV